MSVSNPQSTQCCINDCERKILIQDLESFRSHILNELNQYIDSFKQAQTIEEWNEPKRKFLLFSGDVVSDSLLDIGRQVKKCVTQT